MKSRLPGLDLSRGLCALIVFLGHFLIQDQHFSIEPDSILFKVLDLRHFVVFYFFLLSGFVLKRSLVDRPADGAWFRKRMIRLYPVYFVCWCGPYIGLRVLGSSEIQISNTGAFLGIFGLQSWSLKHALDGPNSPLWSLSVEFGLSLLFIFFSRISSVRALFALIFTTYLLSIQFQLIPVFSGVPFFLFGIYLCHRQENLHQIGLNKASSYLFMISTLVAMYFVFITPPDFRFISGEYLGLACSGLILVSFLIFPIPAFLWSFCSYLGSRSFSLYACHAPVLWLYKRVIFGPVDGAIIKPAGIVYFLCGVLVVLVMTEIIYRAVDIPAINASRRAAKRKN